MQIHCRLRRRKGKSFFSFIEKCNKSSFQRASFLNLEKKCPYHRRKSSSDAWHSLNQLDAHNRSQYYSSLNGNITISKWNIDFISVHDLHILMSVKTTCGSQMFRLIPAILIRECLRCLKQCIAVGRWVCVVWFFLEILFRLHGKLSSTSFLEWRPISKS